MLHRLPSALSTLLLTVVIGGSALAQGGRLDEGVKRLRQGDAKGAAELFAAVTETDPDNGRAWHLLGRALRATGDLDAAMVAYETAAGFEDLEASASYNAACLCSARGDVEGAALWFGRARAAGFADRGLALSDPDLTALRKDARFAGMLPALLEGSDVFVEAPRVIHTFVGESPGDQFGWVGRKVGDLDGDGVIDFATSAPTSSAGGRASGRVYVYSTRTGELLFQRDGKPGEQLGNGLAGAGDVDGDGTPDVVAGAPGSGRAAGAAYVFSGVDGRTLIALRGGQVADRFGVKVCGVGDVNGDGRDDVLVGSLGYDGAGGKADAGRVSVHSGANGEELFVLEGEAAGDNFGSSVDATRSGDVRLLAVGAMNGGPRKAGHVYVYRWKKGAVEPFFEIASDATGSQLGQYFVTLMGDADGDGVDDVYASDWGNTALGPHTGRVYVHSGADGRHLLTLTGTRAGEGFGTSVSDAGDVDGDGRADLIVGAWQNNEVSKSAGKCYLHSGADGKLLATYTSKEGGDTLGFDATGIGDVDGDGGVDFLLTSAWSHVDGPQQGRVFVVAGPVFE